MDTGERNKAGRISCSCLTNVSDMLICCAVVRVRGRVDKSKEFAA